MKNRSSNKIPNSLRKHRLIMGFTQREVAKKLGFKSTNRIVRWEQGCSCPSIKNLLRLSVLYATLSDQLYQELCNIIKKELSCLNNVNDDHEP